MAAATDERFRNRGGCCSDVVVEGRCKEREQLGHILPAIRGRCAAKEEASAEARALGAVIDCSCGDDL